MTICPSNVNAKEASTLKNMYIYYKVPDMVLMCQNSKEDMITGMQEFEKELRLHYSKRFSVLDVKRYPSSNPKLKELRKTDKDNILLVSFELRGQGVRTDNYQNAFGTKFQGKAPTVKVNMAEAILYPTFDLALNYFYGIKEYSQGTIAIGRDIIAVETDYRKVTKNGIRGYLRDTCTLNTNINKYADPTSYKREFYRYNGDFDKLLIVDKNKTKEERRSLFIEAMTQKYPNYIDYYLKRISENDLESWLNLIDTFIISGLYKEVDL